MDQSTDLMQCFIPPPNASAELGYQLTVIMRDGAPWFRSREVCGMLGLANVSQALARLDPEDKVDHAITPPDSLFEVLVSESGLYALIFNSRRAEARAFRRWVTDEVLPSIRKTGAYGVQRELTRRQLLEMALEAEDRADAMSKTLGAALSAVKELESPARAYEELIDSTGLFSMATVAKAFNVGTNRLFAHLRQHGVLIGTAGDRFNTPYQRHMEAGRFEIKLGVRESRDKEPVSTYTTLVTPKGVDFLRKLLRSYPV